MKQRTLYLTQALASLSLHNDHRCDGGHCAETTTPHTAGMVTKKKGGGEFLRRFLFCFVFVFLTTSLSFRFNVDYSYCGYVKIINIYLNMKNVCTLYL